MHLPRLGARVAAALGVAAVVTVGACSPAAMMRESAQAGGGETTAVTIQIDGSAVPYYAPLYAAVEQGYFADEGLDVEFSYANGADIVQNVAAGNVDFGFPNADSVITARANGVRTSVVHTTYQRGIGAVLFDNAGGISSPADLAGRSVAVTDLGSPNYAQLQAMLAHEGLTLDDVELRTIGTGAIVQALQNGEVDAIVFSRLRYFALRTAGVDVGQILSDEYLPSFGNVLITGPETAALRPRVAGGFARALDAGIQHTIDNVDETVDMAIEKYAPTFEGQNAEIADVLREVFVAELWQSDETREHGFGHGDLDRWQAAIDSQAEFGLIEEPFDAADLVRNADDIDK
ncbi:ABC-type nitrate/sulfonate/bicarbonate transport system substrate-binding protein [Actinoalloteichus hoggarensis]|uniref:Putative aliphatic sulfonates-binding protein n=1 Tax=Actinoalloteichus hoggarensis TaxID=1470176 RepID=A0A221W8I9_9PSEU|nr:ABC transporter substrate-binding protein [Actinoalloteichus hoggarensis]ASO21991.1 Putative aliphatic sulfonates-binding protein precursor [Actinoalloteichus hoggarensis]MBB5923929.1 ABC-type nitrate/sulfonate/bicarbonate transport system substrate-binding protein [Actinoalloteichus hoggarensis]